MTAAGCDYGADRCGAEPASLFACGARCAAHTPAALAGKPEPGAGRYCPPAICWCGQCPPRAEYGSRSVQLAASAAWAVLGHAVAVTAGVLTVDGRQVADDVDPAAVAVYGPRLFVAGRQVAELAAAGG